MKAAPSHMPFDSGSSAPASGESAQWVVFCLDAGRYALPLNSVERIVQAAHVTFLPQAPDNVLGMLEVQGQVLPVYNFRQRFGLPQRTIDPADQFVIARTRRRTVVLVVDSAQGVIERHAVDAVSIAPDTTHIRGVIALEDGLVLIHDLDQFLSRQEAIALDEAINRAAPHAS
jgi:purine-binding chemotaxis protein CheW